MAVHYEPTLRGLRIGAIVVEPPAKFRASEPDRAVVDDLTCEICGRAGFKNVAGLNRHKTRMHADERNAG
jgi:hypothetical protein